MQLCLFLLSDPCIWAQQYLRLLDSPRSTLTGQENAVEAALAAIGQTTYFPSISHPALALLESQHVSFIDTIAASCISKAPQTDLMTTLQSVPSFMRAAVCRSLMDASAKAIELSDAPPQQVIMALQALHNLPELRKLKVACNEAFAGAAGALSCVTHVRALQLCAAHNRAGMTHDWSLEGCVSHLAVLTGLRELDISGTLIDWRIALQLVQPLMQLTAMRQLALNHCGLTSAVLRMLWPTLQTLSDLQNISLQQNHLETLAVEGLPSVGHSNDQGIWVDVLVAPLPGVTLLNLSENQLGREAEQLRNLQQFSQLQAIDLSHNGIGLDGTAVLVHTLPLLPKLEHLWLTGNPMSDEDTSTESILRAVSVLTNLQTFAAGDSGVMARQAAACGASLKGLPALTQLLLDADWDASAAAPVDTLAPALSHCTRLEKLALTCHAADVRAAAGFWRHLSTLTALSWLRAELALQNREAPDVDDDSFAAAIARCTALTHLALECDRTAIHAPHAAAPPPLHLWPRLKHLEVQGSGLTRADAVALAPKLTRLTALEHFALCGSTIEAAGVRALMLCLPALSKLTHLSLEHCGIACSQVSTRALAQHIAALPALQDVRLGGAQLCHKCMEHLAAELTALSCLAHLSLAGASGIGTTSFLLPQNESYSSLRSLNLSGQRMCEHDALQLHSAVPLAGALAALSSLDLSNTWLGSTTTLQLAPVVPVASAAAAASAAHDAAPATAAVAQHGNAPAGGMMMQAVHAAFAAAFGAPAAAPAAAHRNDMQVYFAKEVMPALAAMTSLCELYLARNNLRGQSLRLLCTSLPSCVPALRHLSLSSNAMRGGDAPALAAAVRDLTRLTFLDVSANLGLSDGGLASLGSMLAQSGHALELIDMRDCAAVTSDVASWRRSQSMHAHDLVLRVELPLEELLPAVHPGVHISE